MILMKDILKENNKLLKEVSIDCVEPISIEDIKIAKEMMEYVKNSVDEEIQAKYNLRPSVGLAAPQIGILKKIIAMSCIDEYGNLVEFMLINPKLISYSEEHTYLESGEGCLSVDRVVEGFVHRAKRVTFKSYVVINDKVEYKQIRLSGYPAVVFQHEYDHLKGILFIDRINKENPFKIIPNSTPIKFVEE